MITLGLVLFYFIVIWWIAYKLCCKLNKEDAALLATPIALILFSCVLLWGREVHNPRYVNVANIVSLGNNSATYGTYSSLFFIGHGKIGEEEYYFMYKQESDGGFSRISYPVAYSRLYETDKTNPHVERWCWDGIDFKIVPKKMSFDCENITEDTPDHIIKIFVPKGTIVREFNVNN